MILKSIKKRINKEKNIRHLEKGKRLILDNTYTIFETLQKKEFSTFWGGLGWKLRL